MNNYSNRPGPMPGGSPVASALVIVAGIFLIGLSLVVGVVAFVALAAIILVTTGVVAVRAWWARLRYARTGEGQPTRPRPPSDGDVIEGEFKVIRRDDNRDG